MRWDASPAISRPRYRIDPRRGGVKPMIDRITTKTCPDVRTEALQALNLPNFASGILF